MFNLFRKKQVNQDKKGFFVGCSGSLYSPVAFELIDGFIVQKSTKRVIEAQRR